MLHSYSCCRLSYRRPSMWTAMSWLFPTTCSYITIPSTGEGLADSTLQKVRLLIWRMVGTFFTSYDLLRSFFPLILPFQTPPPHSTPLPPPTPKKTHNLVASSSRRIICPSTTSTFFFKLFDFFVAFCLPHASSSVLMEFRMHHSLFIMLISPAPITKLRLSHDSKMLYYFQSPNAPTFVPKADVKHDQIA